MKSVAFPLRAAPVAGRKRIRRCGVLRVAYIPYDARERTFLSRIRRGRRDQERFAAPAYPGYGATRRRAYAQPDLPDSRLRCT